jgi:O-antigen chain-terminating methyltransferase
MDDRLAAYLELAAVSDEEFVRRAYRLVLRRDPEPEALARRVSRATLLRELVTSDEFERVRTLDDAVSGALGARRPARFLEGPSELGERVIEIPWALSRYRGEQRVLDVGTANAEPAYLAALAGLGVRDLVGVDLAEAVVPGMRTVVADVRDLPFEDGSFDLVLCVSTLEHVGRDNRVYGLDQEPEGGGVAEALAELARVLDRRGRLLVTVPTGERNDHGWFVQHEPEGWNARFVEGGFRVAEQEVYERGPAGWRAAPGFDPAGVRYGQRGAGAAAVLCTELRPRSALRRAVRRARAAARRSGADRRGSRPRRAPGGRRAG